MSATPLVDRAAVVACLKRLKLDSWADELPALLDTRLAPAAHGDLARWTDVLTSLAGKSRDPAALRPALLELAPWRKGPFDLAGVRIDAEWRSDLKWSRFADAIEPLEGRAVLDVGCGNGYYALRMREAGAHSVIGIDPTLLYVVQFAAVNSILGVDRVFVLPLRLHEVPLPARRFDTSFSMGVLYHQRSPLDHLRQLRNTLRPGGQLVLETIVLPGDDARASTPEDRYARMKNVWLLPTVAELCTWMRRTGFRNIVSGDLALTTVHEQHSTEWMPFESLAEALDGSDPTKTIEGWPAPHRVVVTATAPQ